ncbi:unnamed protein product [Psylliodes chrysocephalus]|uniref:Uncharacterized protein n=1 Tax=Psylliodes chrysocephalus TaxID=3402493 RepID=A0A9P0CVR1_9CUCU|nr:unnamed protein product [Psylliodes chrysocephala]
MNSRLSTFAPYLENFLNLRSQFAKLFEDHYKLLTKKGIMPYDYFDSFERFNETCFPPIDAFYNTLENKPCSRRMYLRAQDIWSKFLCRNLGDYNIKTDILLLADVFEPFRSSSHKFTV